MPFASRYPILTSTKGPQQHRRPEDVITLRRGKKLLTATKVAAVVKVPRRIARRLTIRKNTSAKFSHDLEMGARCRVIRGCFVSQSLISWCMWV